MKPRPYSLEERMIEPFRAIRWLDISVRTRLLSGLGLTAFCLVWWFCRQSIFNFWALELKFFVKLTHAPWTISEGFWPEYASRYVSLPKLTAGILPPTTLTWWCFALVSFTLWAYTDGWQSKFLPLKAVLRFVLFLIFTSLACFAISPMQFQHSVDEWSKIYFLGAYGSFLVYAFIWTLGVLWFPIPTLPKLYLSLTLIAFEIIAVPLLIFMCTLGLQKSSLLLLPLFALGVAPILQLGWFICFYSMALSHGADPKKAVNFE